MIKVLLIEDNFVVYKAHSFFLSEVGCEVEWAKNGNQAIEKSKNLYDIIFSDIGLPDINGIEVITHIRSNENVNKNTPIFVITAFSDEETKTKCLKIGVNGFYVKPFLPDDFKKVIQTRGKPFK